MINNNKPSYNTGSELWYSAWRRSESYSVPMSKEGMEAAEKRMETFKVGFEYGLRCAMSQLEQEHSKVKKTHSFFYKASQMIKELLVSQK